MLWGVPIWIYLWSAGMAGGAYFAGFLVNVFGGWKHRALFRLSILAGVPLATIGVLCLLFDLGTPIWIWHFFVNFDPLATISMATWILTFWMIVCSILVVTWIIEWDIDKNPAKYSGNMAGMVGKISKFFAWIGFFLSILMAGYTGVLLASTSQPLWASTLLLPALFVASAISTGIALLVLIGFAVNAMTTRISISSKIIGRLAEADAVVIIIELLTLIGFAVWTAVSGDAGSEALSSLISGELAILFWVGFALLALLLPFALDIFNWGKSIEQKSVAWAVGISALSVIVGGFILRAVITIGGQL